MIYEHYDDKLAKIEDRLTLIEQTLTRIQDQLNQWHEEKLRLSSNTESEEEKETSGNLKIH